MAAIELNGLPLDESQKTYGLDKHDSCYEGVEVFQANAFQVYRCPGYSIPGSEKKKRCKAFIWFEHEGILRPLIPTALRPRRWLGNKRSEKQSTLDGWLTKTGKSAQRLRGKDYNKPDGIGGHLAGTGAHVAARDGYPAAGGSSAQIESASSRDEQSKDSSHIPRL
ncbi:hypothetical protein BDP55DRAFT_630947 [Colletotrichum godetiae]|uniref:Uncharacterized protein n=1 Tax=Colletotrichum godetiae TaxID=1209918 RepID=A0AAJ0ASA1_9PEZI|nr:uncharacterized protein BDP55DRAFT_630947 [Colletotrichum godetiae]KAK1676861.1 hypothetical protein BDP55DRAFT_630947 [Colletotrichum godetiae]